MEDKQLQSHQVGRKLSPGPAEELPDTTGGNPMTTDRCVIAGVTVDEKVARINAFIAIIGVAIFALTPAKGVIFFLALDFFLRGFGFGRYSPVAWASRGILTTLHVTPSPIDAGPKLFAAKIGFVFALLAGLLWAFGLEVAGLVVALGLAGAASLEAFLGYCVGCTMYSILVRVFSRS